MYGHRCALLFIRQPASIELPAGKRFAMSGKVHVPKLLIARKLGSKLPAGKRFLAGAAIDVVSRPKRRRVGLAD